METKPNDSQFILQENTDEWTNITNADDRQMHCMVEFSYEHSIMLQGMYKNAEQAQLIQILMSRWQEEKWLRDCEIGFIVGPWMAQASVRKTAQLASLSVGTVTYSKWHLHLDQWENQMNDA